MRMNILSAGVKACTVIRGADVEYWEYEVFGTVNSASLYPLSLGNYHFSSLGILFI